jgi:hypothetical protein
MSPQFVLEQLLVDCKAGGIHLTADGRGGLVIDAPEVALTSGLISRLESHKQSILERLKVDPAKRQFDPTDARADHAALDESDGEPCFPPIEALRSAEVEWTGGATDARRDLSSILSPLGADGWPATSVDPDELTPCTRCGRLELWQSVAGDLFGLTPGRWRCVYCEPPLAANRLREQTERIRKSTATRKRNESA